MRLDKLSCFTQIRGSVETLIKRHPKMLALAALCLLILAQSMAWFQINGQFLSKWSKEHPITLSLLGVPISYLFIVATKLAFDGLGHKVWPPRLIGAASGVIVFTLLTYWLLGESLTWKSAVSIILSLVIVVLQIV